MTIYASASHCDGLTNQICTIRICSMLSLLLLIDGDGVTLHNGKAERVGERKVNIGTIVLNCWSALGE